MPSLAKILIPAAALSLALLAGCESSLEKFRTRGISEYNKNEFDQSLADLNKALTFDQFDAQSNAYAGLIHYRAGNYVQAAYHFNLALQADPSSEEAKDGLTATYIKQGKPDQALDALERASQMADKVADPRWKKTNWNRRYQNQVEERMYLGKVDDRVRIARAYEKLGDYDNAFLYYNKALEKSPDDAATLMAIATLSEKAGNKAQAREYLARAYRSDPATPGLVQAMTRNGLAISDVIAPPAPQPPIVPANDSK